MGPESHRTGVLTRREEAPKQKDKGECQAMTEAEGCQELVATPEPGGGQGRPSPWSFRGSVACRPLTLDLEPSEVWKNTFLIFYAT